MNVVAKNWWQGPKRLKVESFLRDQAMILDLDITIEIEKGWLSEHGRYWVTGEESKVNEFQRMVQLAIASYKS